MGFFDNLLHGAEQAGRTVGFFGNLLAGNFGAAAANANNPVTRGIANLQVPTAPGITGPSGQPNTPVNVGQVAQQIPGAAFNTLVKPVTQPFVQSMQQLGPNASPAQVAGGFGKATENLVGGVAQTALSIPGTAVATVAGKQIGPYAPIGEQIKQQGLVPALAQQAASAGILAGGAETAGGFFDKLSGADIKPIDTTLTSSKTAAQDFTDGQRVSGTPQEIDRHTLAVSKATDTPTLNFTKNDAGPDTQYTFNNLKDPAGLQKSLAAQGVNASTITGNDTLVVHDTDGLAKSIINGTVKQNYLEPPTIVKGDVNIKEGNIDATTGRPSVQPTAESPATTVPEQGTENSGGLQNPAVPAQPNDAGGPGASQVLDENAKQAIVNMGKVLPEDVKSATTDWINQRESAGLQAQVAARPFQALDAEGTDAFKRIQAGDTSGPLGAVRQYFDQKFTQLQEAGVGKFAGFEYQNNYLPQIWDNSPEEIQRVFGDKSIVKNPSFTFEKVIKDYQTGIDADLTPRFSKVSELVQWYDQTANKAIADNNFFKSMVQKGYMENGHITGWEDIKGMDYSAPRPLAEAINNYLGQGSPLLQATSKGVGFLKNQVMTQGVPGTALSPHGVTTLAREALATPISQGGFIGGLIKGIPEMLYPNLAKARFEGALPDALDLYKSGLTPTGEDIHLRSATDLDPQGIVGKVIDFDRKLFHDPVFQKQLPEAKQSAALDWSQKFQASGIDKATADAAAGKFANTFFGGNNYDALMRNKDFQNSARTLAFAPDMIESLAKTFGETAKSLTTKLTDPTYAPYRTVALNAAIGVGIVGNLLNKALSGHYMFENSGSMANKFKLDIGGTPPQIVQSLTKTFGLPITYSGNESYVNFLGSAGDFIRLPAEIGNDVRTFNVQDLGDIVRNRLSGPAQGLVSLASNTTPTGRPIAGAGISGPQAAANAINSILGSAAPPVVQQGANTAESALGLKPQGQSAASLAVQSFINNQHGGSNPGATTSANTGSTTGTFGHGTSAKTKAASAARGARRAGSSAARRARSQARRSASRTRSAGRSGGIKAGGRVRAKI